MQAKDNNHDPAYFGEDEAQVKQQSSKGRRGNAQSDEHQAETKYKCQTMGECNEAICLGRLTTGRTPTEVAEIAAEIAGSLERTS